MKASDWIDLYIRLSEARSAPPSAFGFALENARDGRIPTHASSGVMEERNILYAHAVYLVDRVLVDLGPYNRTVVIMHRTPKQHVGRCFGNARQSGESDTPGFDLVSCPCGAVRYRYREVPNGDLVEYRTEGGQTVMMTRSGGIVVRGARDETTGELLEHRSVVEEPCATYPSREEIAASLGLSFSTVKRTIANSYAAIDAKAVAE